MSKKDLAYATLAGIKDSGWRCGDCGNFYDSSVEYCPNQLLDRAEVDLRKEERMNSGEANVQYGYISGQRTEGGKIIIVGPFESREQAQDLAGECEVVEMHGPEQARHYRECACYETSCCPWMGECDCQCVCGLIERVEERIRAEYA